ncbi:cobalamin biosynthesis protein CobW [Aquimarina muelleri]|uniref:Cobalamin biosynthesis protein CobW n=1 Tax=Aquimarina muelleri TaxID=279356 RepID=A0A918N0S5_9FLAO|nr:cobalamin biosynthesis protein CobW [Aquimarina muelleri]MCX2764347.1 cobalamin biosynthesis protein CobW [Aquimarina muelleri]GGX04974.1 cobalamin biosynthesis protein CobW [Aquimarina muelleri]
MALHTQKIPVTIITGFLGSGKTTLIHKIAQNANGRRLAIIVNEFGELGMDGEILKGNDCGCEEENILELSNGCLCCTVQEEFLPTMLQLMERKQDIDHIIIETSGLALPKPLLKAFNWPDLKPQITVDAVITVVDSVGQATGEICDRDKVQSQRLEDENLDHESSIEELFEDQLACADLIVMTKSDLINQEQYDEVKNVIQNRVGEKIKLISAIKGDVSVEVLLGIGAQSEDHVDSKHSHHEDHHHHHDHEHDDHHHDHEHDDTINSIVIEVKVAHTPVTLIKALKELVAENSIYRIKGIIHVPGKPMRMIVQGVAERFENYFDRKWTDAEPKTTRVVIIGEKLEEQKIQQVLEEKLMIEAEV